MEGSSVAAQQLAIQQPMGLLATEARFEAVYELLTRLAGRPDVTSTLNEVLAASVELVGADAGYIRLFDAEDVHPDVSRYPFVAQVGISDAYIEYFSSLPGPVDRDARGAVYSGKRVIVEDMTTHPSFAAHREVVIVEGYRSLQATPLMSQNGSRCVGVICTYFSDSYTPPDSVLDTLDLYAELAANAIDQQQQLAALAERDATLTALVDRQVAMLKHLQQRVLALEERAATFQPEDIRLVARAVRDELRRAAAEMSAADVELSTSPPTIDPEKFPYGFTCREMKVMLHAWQGLSDKQIAKEMGISRYTVAKHISAGMRKMNVETRTQASVLFEREALYKGYADD
jgi:GAF domain-containing protein/DNA-binding CsgD family transcriptional regulator